VLEADERQLVIADIPGLIEGASEGAGLGHDFLAHIERTRLLVHVLDIAPEISGDEQSDAAINHETIERELAAHDPRLATLPRVLALSKADLVSAERMAEEAERWRKRLPDVSVVVTSSATSTGIAELAAELLHRVPAQGENEGGSVAAGQGAGGGETELAEHMVFRPSGPDGFSIEQVGPGEYSVNGRGVERLLARHDLNNEDALAYVEERLRKIGVLRALEARGFQHGDDLTIAGVAFELDPEDPA
jgi:GTP-binding protein